MEKFTITDLNNSVSIYTDIVKKGKNSEFSGEIGWRCLRVLEHFEEYEKCKDIFPHLDRSHDIPNEIQNRHKSNSV